MGGLVDTIRQSKAEIVQWKPWNRLAIKLTEETTGTLNDFGLGQLRGGLAQLGERLHGMQEVRGSNPLSSTS